MVVINTFRDTVLKDSCLEWKNGCYPTITVVAYWVFLWLKNSSGWPGKDIILLGDLISSAVPHWRAGGLQVMFINQSLHSAMGSLELLVLKIVVIPCLLLLFFSSFTEPVPSRKGFEWGKLSKWNRIKIRKLWMVWRQQIGRNVSHRPKILELRLIQQHCSGVGSGDNRKCFFMQSDAG